MRIITVLVLTFGLLASGPAGAQPLPGEPITYANFDYIRAVTSSLNYAYFATTDGIIKYDKLGQDWEQPLTGTEGYPDEMVNEIYVDRFDNKLVIVTDIGVYEYEDFFNEWRPVNDLPPLENDVRHVRPPDYILPQFDANYMGSGKFIDYNSRSFSMSDVVEDPSGDLWIGTWGYGAAKADRSSGLMKLLPYGLVQNRVDVIHPDDSVLWTAGLLENSLRVGITAFNPEKNEFFRVETSDRMDRPVEDIYCLESDSSTLYIGTPYGLYLFDRANWSARGPVDARRGLSDDFVVSLDRLDHRLFVGTTGGLSMIDQTTDSVYQIRSETFDRHIVYDLEHVDSTVWIASSVGAFRYTPKDGRLQQFQDPDLVLFSAVLDVEINDDEAWFSSDGGAVRLNLKTGDIKSYREASSLRDRRALAVNDQVIALADDFGISLIVRGEKKDRFYSFDSSDGLASDLILALEIEGDYLWIGSDRGLTRFRWNDSMILN